MSRSLQLFIDGEFVEGVVQKEFVSITPSTQEAVATHVRDDAHATKV